jgi:hypothetical protein
MCRHMLSATRPLAQQSCPRRPPPPLVRRAAAATAGDAPDFVEVGEAGVAVGDAMRHERCVQLVWVTYLDWWAANAALSTGRSLFAFNRRKPLVASIMPAAVQRSAITALRQRFTLRLTRRTVPIMFSIALVQASERRSGVGSLRRCRDKYWSGYRTAHWHSRQRN